MCLMFKPNRKQHFHEDALSGRHTCTRVRASTSPPIALCHVLDVRSDWSQTTGDVRDAASQTLGKNNNTGTGHHFSN